jgi:hypothetical protein
MKKLAALLMTCALLVCFGISCEKTTPTTEFSPEIYSQLGELPSSYGELESVTAITEYPGWFQLWFEDDAGIIRMVRIQVFDSLMHNTILTIPRSGLSEEEVTEDEG